MVGALACLLPLVTVDTQEMSKGWEKMKERSKLTFGIMFVPTVVP